MLAVAENSTFVEVFRVHTTRMGVFRGNLSTLHRNMLLQEPVQNVCFFGCVVHCIS